MSTRDSGIKEGDRAVFHFSNHPPIDGRVKYLPSDTGDSWILVDGNGFVFHIQQFDFACKVPEGE